MGFAIIAAAAFLCVGADSGDWPFYGHDPGGQRFSPLSSINRANVTTLKIAWTYRTGDAYQPKDRRPTAFEATPLYIGGTLYLSTPLGRIIALDPVSGKERWTYDGKVPRDKGYGDFANRGVSALISPKGQLRILMATVDARLIAVDASTGKPCLDFGDNGAVDLRSGLRIAPRDFSDYEETSPPAIVGSMIVVGSGIADNGATDQPSGEVRGFDAAIYAFEVEKGAQLWRGDLPTSARAAPMTYRAPNGKQYLVVSAGGHGIPGAAPLGDYVVAFSLP